MKIVKQSCSILYPKNNEEWKREAKLIELAGRVSYKSEGGITTDSYDRFIRNRASRGDVAVFKFGSMAVKLVTDRGVSHELAQHELRAFEQEDIWRCNYDDDKFGRELTVIEPSTWGSWSDSQKEWWEGSLKYAELNYLLMVQDDMEPRQARSVLPDSLKTEAVIRADFLEWRRIFRLCALSKAAHPDMRALMIPLYKDCCSLLPCVFDMGEPE